jgi:hypothetical protein
VAVRLLHEVAPGAAPDDECHTQVETFIEKYTPKQPGTKEKAAAKG